MAGALADIRVLDLTRLLPGGLCTLHLADLGADVTKVEMPGGGDYARSREPLLRADDPSTASASFVAVNRNKSSVVLDLKSDRGRDRLLALAEKADVLVESFRPGVLDRLGVGYGVLSRRNRRLIYCAISGWGNQGPLSQRAGHDINYLASVGLLSLTGRPAEEPCIPPFQAADAAGGLLAALAILAALHERTRSGAGQEIDLALADSVLSLFAMQAAGALAGVPTAPRDQALFSGGVVCYQTYRCADGWVALGALEERFWRAFCRGVGREDLAAHRYDATGSATHTDVSALLAARTLAEWEAFAAEHDCCLTTVVGLDEALASPHVAARGMVATIDQPGVAERVRALASPLRLLRTPPDETRLPAPSLDADGEPLAKASPEPA